MTIRLRLTLLYSCILASTLLLFGVALYSFLQLYIFNDLKSSLKAQTNAFQENAQYKLEVDPSGWNLSIRLDKFDTVQTGMYIQAVNLINGAQARSINLGTVELPFSHKTLDEKKQGYYVTTKVQHSLFLIYNDPLMLDDHVVGVIQSAYNIGVISKFLSILRFLLVSLSLLVVILASYIGWLSARRSLKPIYTLIEETQQIQSSEDLGKRVQFQNAADEVSLLSKTINGMLERIQTNYAELDRLYVNQRRFVADASHELRTPLTTISGNAEFLQKIWTAYNGTPNRLTDKNEMELSVEALNDIVDEANRMRRLVNDLLLLARADAGQQIQKNSFEVKPIVEAVVRKAQLIPKSVHFRVENMEVLEGLYLAGDKDYLQQLLFLFLDNAFKFTMEGWVELQSSATADHIVFTIRDSGIGMAAHEIPHVFERFYRADTSRGVTPGTGLGLSIAKWILDEHEGSVEVLSNPGKGTSFVIRLPILQGQAD
ncbi:sensor histidine kinase [Paenibacillus sepulcri]|uniref:histidine kinase n=1 Tax=Paenibacillus sepulcri TaxID=359917 RepID=A0ABS7CCE2_9BACL|nr:HAMP domain-containing histidine kinase [Paenibacillus sepulcri]